MTTHYFLLQPTDHGTRQHLVGDRDAYTAACNPGILLIESDSDWTTEDPWPYDGCKNCRRLARTDPQRWSGYEQPTMDELEAPAIAPASTDVDSITAAPLSTTVDAPISTSSRRGPGGRARVAMVTDWQGVRAPRSTEPWYHSETDAQTLVDLDSLRESVQAQREAEQQVNEWVRVLRDRGASWTVIADATGLTRAGAHKRWGTR